MFANRFTAIIDACVLVSARKRNLILSLAEDGFFRIRWSDAILKETQGAISDLLINRKFTVDDSTKRAEAAVQQMKTAFPEAMVNGFEGLIPALSQMPDKDDRHVLAAAIHCNANLIVTDNLKDFPAEILEQFGIEAKNADDFLADEIDLDIFRAAKTISRLRARLKKPQLTAEDLLNGWESNGLMETADLLRKFTGMI